MNHTALPIRNRILIGDVRERLSELPSASVHCVITSPPYFGLRDYGHSAQIGAEQDVNAWAEEIAAVCDEISRVLRPDGVLWLNLADGYSRHAREGAAKKSLLLGPERVAMRLTTSGWLLRNKVVWAKRNPMPSSVQDRLSTTHEFVYCFARSRSYFFDLDAIREPARTAVHGGRRSSPAYPPRSAVPSLGGGSSPRVDLNQGLRAMKARGQENHPLGKNPGDVWTTATASYRGAHFATFPSELIRRPLLATCPARTCVACGSPWHRLKTPRHSRRALLAELRPSCACGGGWQPGIVLDPFLGSGTVAVTAEAHGRDWTGIELNPAYAKLATERITAARQQRAADANDAAVTPQP